MKMLGKIDEWDKLYNSQNREYRQLRLRALMGQQQGEQQAANMDATATGQDNTLAQKQYDTLIGNLWKAQQEKEKRADTLDDKMKVEKLRGENNIKTAQVRAAASAAAASTRSAAAADKSAVQFLDRDERTVVRLNPAQESLLYEKGHEMGIIPEDGTPTKEPTSTGEEAPRFVVWEARTIRRKHGIPCHLPQAERRKAEAASPAMGLLFAPRSFVAARFRNDVNKVLEIPQAERMREAGYSDPTNSRLLSQLQITMPLPRTRT
ncbi:MAG: hypothetical protein V8Q45_05220, partial [Alistipes onderdonkii]